MNTREPNINWLILQMLIPVGEIVAGIRGVSQYSWSSASRNGKFIFAGVSTTPISDQLKFARDAGEVSTDEQMNKFSNRLNRIPQQYPITGMYSNDGSHTATRTEWAHHGMPSNDGQELGVVLEEGAFGNAPKILARILFADGRTLKLTLDEAVPRWQQWLRSFEFDDLLACTKADLERLRQSIDTNRHQSGR